MDSSSSPDISKSQRKRDAKKMQDLATTLLRMPAALFNTMPFPEAVESAIRQGRMIKSHGARKRQMQFIAKLLRKHDVVPILAAIDQGQEQSRRSNMQFHILEQWRDRLIDLGDEALEIFCQVNPAADRQQIRQLIRSAQKELAAGKPPVSQRLLFRLLRNLDKQNPISAPGP